MAKKVNVYKVDGRVYPSVSQILNVISEGWIEVWKLRVGQERVEQTIQEGVLLHDVLKAYSEQQTPIIYDEWLARAINNLGQWFSLKKFTWVASEVMVVNDEVGYAGTCDGIMKDQDGNLYVVDFKTGSGVQMTHHMQIAAYRFATRVEGDLDLCPKTDLTGAYILHLDKKTGIWTDHPILDLEEAFEAFKACASIYKYKSQHWK